MSNNKKLTVQEFRYWLEGVEEMQPEGWTPDTRQWVRIREKINDIIDVVPQAPVSIPQQPTTLIRAPEQTEQQIPYSGPFQMASPGLTQFTSPPSNNALFGNADHPTTPVRTPNVDTSSGNYESAFL